MSNLFLAQLLLIIRQFCEWIDSVKNKTAVILCGGYASRLGSSANGKPKALIELYGRPLLWYALNRLFQFHFDRVILPIGFLGDQIRAFVESLPTELQAKITIVDTGENTPIGGRLFQISDHLPTDGDFFLMNGDTYFDFDINGMHAKHKKEDRLVTLAIGNVVSPYGLVIEKDGEPVSFSRNAEISGTVFAANGSEGAPVGSIFIGFAWLRTSAMERIDLAKTHNFEHELYSSLVQSGDAGLYRAGHKWFPVDTAKDIKSINSNDWVLHNIQVRHTGKDLKSRYSYANRYFDDPELLKEQILNKTVLPHQLEVQPGPTSLTSLCWMKCPYCYGLSSEDSGERLSLDRYLDVLGQAAEGGVRKFIFAGYATDPLNYKHIDQLHAVPLQKGAITGFHTKAIKVSDQLISQITAANIAPQSYFSVSVDAGTNQTYNIVHGVDSVAKVYDRVIENIMRIAEARERESSVLDLSATYLINDHNNGPSEILKAIHDLRSAGVDLIRFTFPQVPRGFDDEIASGAVPSRDSVVEYMNKLRPIIEQENSENCQVLIMDLDDEFSIINKDRSLPCFARFLFPSIGFDGYLAHCSESAAPHFREMSLANLETTDFWDAYYDYPEEGMADYLRESGSIMHKTKCKCDRKEHVVNQGLSGVRF